MLLALTQWVGHEAVQSLEVGPLQELGEQKAEQRVESTVPGSRVRINKTNEM
jgi:hypothetical protein